MMNKFLKFTKTKPVKSPDRGTKLSAGIDFFIPDDFKEMNLGPGSSILIPLGIHVLPPQGMALVFFNKSGVSTKLNLDVGACVIDEDYQGEIHAHLFNYSNDFLAELRPGMKIVQGVLLDVGYGDVFEMKTLAKLYPKESKRGSGGFGSTGQ
jgi:dUTP pyrophosphatase